MKKKLPFNVWMSNLVFSLALSAVTTMPFSIMGPLGRCNGRLRRVLSFQLVL